MSYQVLARKWRPKNFQELMGQEHVVAVLANALSQNRLHHAYLFTGTRGVGKTTIARIFAKSLNCDTGITEKPCGQCDTCIDIDQGRFVDLLEIDAASKTKVDDTREILDNVQYAPSRGRFKVYLIDEVHMLSRHSFNALLKTLEEPPEHVKFILATTDPQKLPVTVLSRCLQFHLKALTVNQIEQKLVEILASEQVSHEPGCLTMLAKAARGSMRDSLSLTDQAIAQGQGNITLPNIQQMLGGIDQNWVYQLVICLLKQDGPALMALSQEIASYAPSYSRLFAELIQLFHQIALMQLVEQHFDLPADLLSLLKKFCQGLSAEDVQLYYQISVNGRKDLPYAADEQAAFDMTLLRLFAFKPTVKEQLLTDVSTSGAVKANFDELSLTSVKDQSTTLPSAASIEPVLNTQLPESIDSSISHEINSNDNVGHDIDNTVEVTDSSLSIGIDTTPLISEPILSESVVTDNTLEGLSAQQVAIEQQAEQLYTEQPNTPTTQVTQDSSHQAQSVDEMPEYLSQVPGGQYPEAVDISPDEFVEQGLPVLNNESSRIVQPTSAVNASAVNTSEVNASEVNSLDTSVLNSSQSSVPNTNTTINTTVSSVLATRNMLRSRRKELEKDVKKSDDAAMRQSTATINSTAGIEQNSESSSAALPNTPEKPELAPEPETPYNQDSIDPATIKKANQVDKWAHMIDAMQLTARIRQLAIHATISEQSTDDNLILLLDQATRHLKTDIAQQQLQQTICDFLSKQVTVTLTVVEETVADPYQIQSQINDKRHDYAKRLIKEDNIVMALQEAFQAEVDETTISAR